MSARDKIASRSWCASAVLASLLAVAPTEASAVVIARTQRRPGIGTRSAGTAAVESPPDSVADSAPSAGADAVWSELAPLPIAVSNNAVAAVTNPDGSAVVYSFMGIQSPADPNTITPASFRMTTPGGSWESIADAPLLNGRAKIAANAVAVGDDIYLLGGYSVAGFFETTEHRLFRYDPSKDGYVSLADVPVEVDDTVVGVYLDRYLYLVSGWHGPASRNVDNVQVYDTQSDTWAQATPIPDPLPGLFGHAGAIIGNRVIYMDGARMGPNFPISSRVFVGMIDPETMGEIDTIAWAELPAHPGSPTYRAAASSAATLDGRMLLAGGTDNTYNFSGIGYNGVPSQPLDQLLAYDPLANQWDVLSTTGVHQPTMDHRALVRIRDDAWVTVGGMISPTVATDQVYQLTLLAVCGNGAVEPGETCDTAIPPADPGACPSDCTPSADCTAVAFLNPGTCLAECVVTEITEAVDGDGCCPPGNNANSDSDCAPMCGNAACEPTETPINCAADCPCDTIEQCQDADVCTFDRCEAGACTNLPAAYGDLAGPGASCGPDGLVDINDIFAVLDGFQGLFADGCGPINIDLAGATCDPDGQIDIFDIFAVLDAFVGTGDCCDGRARQP